MKEHPEGAQPSKITDLVRSRLKSPSPQVSVLEKVVPPSLTKVKKKKETPVSGLLISTEIEALVVDSEGNSVEGSWIYSRKIGYDSAGNPDTTSVYFDVDHPITNHEGSLSSKVPYPENTGKDELFEIFAYNPEVGLGYQKLTLEELSLFHSEPLELQLVEGESIIGQVVDENGDPLKGAKLTVFTTCTSGINLSGLTAVSKEDGSFVMRGLILDNTPNLVTAAYTLSTGEGRPVTMSLKPGVTPSIKRYKGARLNTRKTIRDEYLSEEVRTWDIGKIVLPLIHENDFSEE